jgi:hypothetical protein
LIVPAAGKSVIAMFGISWTPSLVGSRHFQRRHHSCWWK